MGTIINSKKVGDKVIMEIQADYDEYLQLRGHLEDIRLITEKTAEIKTNISQRGKNEATKYFLIPRQLRKGFKCNNTTSCQRVDYGNKVMFFYIINKMKINPSRRELLIERMRKHEENIIR